MGAISFDNGAAASLQLSLPGFEGPLDLLLRLIERQQLPVTDVSLALVSDHFIEETRKAGGLPAETMAEFTAIGSRLVALKSRSLLPRPAAPDEPEEASDLVVQLLEYKALKDAIRKLSELDQAGAAAFARGAEAVNLPDRSQQLPLAQHEPASLVRAIRRRLLMTPGVPLLVAIRPLVSLRLMMTRLVDALAGGTTTFRAASRQSCEEPGDERALFLALLVLIRRRIVDADQATPFGEITIRQVQPAAAVAFADDSEFEMA